jgi:cystathionine beta-lyase family protein involved in aluminum resistance
VTTIEALFDAFDIDAELQAVARRARDRCAEIDYAPQRRVAAKMLRDFADEGTVDSDLSGSTGYGYDDAARNRYESLLGRLFGAQRVLARLSIVSGTHAIVTALAACAPAGGRLVSATGRPYDTLRNAICDAPYSLVAEGGVEYREIALTAEGKVDLEALRADLQRHRTHAVFLQRSRGYAPRRSLDVEGCGEAIAAVRAVSPETVVLVDNCYGELVEEREPTHVGADLVMGSLIKTLGGSLAPAGGYVAGRADLIERVAARLYAPGLAAALGPTLGFGRSFLQGLFVAPLVVEQCLRGLDFAAALFEELGFAVEPRAGERRTDIVQAIRLGSAERLARFAAGLQQAMPLNARFRPEPGAVPGYVDPVVMSSGAFVAGATIELSCDAPLRAPFEVYLQGGVTAEHAYLGALFAARALREVQ